MPILLEKDANMLLPKMYRVKQSFKKEHIDDVESAVRAQFERKEISEKVFNGAKVAVAVGSRGIKNLLAIVKTTVDCLKEKGAEPFIVSAMGSHGGGSEEGQKEVLTGYGITQENLGVPIITNVESTLLGYIKNDIPVYFDKAAQTADLIIPINRIKLHTDFVGDLQSGLCKMLVIGLGNQIGCSAIHEVNPENFADILEEAAGIIIEKTNVSFGMAILENGYDQTYAVEAVPREIFIDREKELVKIAKENMPTLMIDDIDVLIMDEIGKDVSGAGFDPNIVGKSSVLKKFVLKVPDIKRMVLLDVTDVSHGNGIGVGLFDVITRNVYEKLDLPSIYANGIACKCIEDCRIPLIAENESEAVRIALKVCRGIDEKALKIVKIKNTLELEHIWISEALLPLVEKNDRMMLEEGELSL